MIRAEDIFVVFCPGTTLERIALRGVNFKISEGEIVSISGNNGCGRSTLLRFLAGHINSNFGRLWFNKLDLTGQSFSERSKIFSTVFYDCDTGSAKNLTVAENLTMASLHHQHRSLLTPAMNKEMRDMFYEQLRELDFMEMEELLDEKVCNITKAHRQVLALLIAVIKEAKVLLIDEHSTGLDLESAAALHEVTEKIIKSKKMTTIMAVSDQKFAMSISDRILILNRGQIVGDISGYAKENLKIEDLFAAFDFIPQLNGASIIKG